LISAIDMIKRQNLVDAETYMCLWCVASSTVLHHLVENQ